MKVKCTGVYEASEEIIEVPDDTTDDELEEQARENAFEVTHFDYWYDKL